MPQTKVAGAARTHSDAAEAKALRTSSGSASEDVNDHPPTLEAGRTDDAVGFGTLLREHRLAAGLSQERLAERARMSVDAISALERGTRKSPRRDTVDLISNALSLDAGARSTLLAAAEYAREPHGAAPAKRPADPDAHNLPHLLTMLHGRDRDLAFIIEQLASHRLVTLTGIGGVGKTRLALETGWGVLGEFADGVHLVDLAPIADPELVAPRVASALGVPAQAGQLAGDLWMDGLRDKRALLVLDNCEHVLDAATTVALRLLQRCPRVRVLATSREPLHVPGERVVHLAPLALPPADEGDVAIDAIRAAPAVTLFLERISDAAPDFSIASADAETWTSVRNVCARLDGIPLAIELAAARVPALGLQTLERGLRDRFRLLTGGMRTSLPRQQTLQATLDWSYEMLSAAEQHVFDRLGVFAGGFTSDAVAAVCTTADADESDVLSALSSLVEKSLVVADGQHAVTRYRVLETTGAYASRRLAAAGAAHAARLQHARYYHTLSLGLRGAFGSTPFVKWVDEYRVELDNFRAVLAWAIQERGDPRLGAEMLCNLMRLVEWLALHAEVVRWCERAIAAFDGAAPPLIEAELHLMATRQHNALGAFQIGLQATERAAVLYRQHGTKLELAYALTLFAKALASDPARREDADRAVDEALAIYADAARLEERRAGEPELAPLMMAALARAFKAFTIEPGEIERRRTYLLDALERFRTLIPGHWIIGVVLAWLSEIELEAGRYDASLAWARESIESYHNPGSRYGGYIFALNMSATVRFAMGEREDARACAAELLAFSRRIGSAAGFAMVLLLLAAIEADSGNFTLAAGLLGAWETSSARPDTPVATMSYLLSRARPGMIVALGKGGFDEKVEAGSRWSVDDAMNAASIAGMRR